MTAFFKFGPKLFEIVYLPVENCPHRQIFVKNRLLPTLEINDRQTPHAQGYSVTDIEPLVVRSAVTDRVTHGFQGFVRGLRFSVENRYSGYSTQDSK
jgi:hypothetical protein